MTQPVIRGSDVVIAGVLWPRYKLLALLTGLIAFLLIGAVTTSAAPAVLGSTALAVTVGLVLKVVTYQRD